MQDKIARLVEIKKEIADLKAEADQIEADFLKQSEAELQDTKLKTVVYLGNAGNKITATMSDTLKLVYPSILKSIFGKAYNDVVTEETTYKLSAAGKRLLIALYLRNYCKDSLITVIDNLSCDDKAKMTLKKKLKGANYITDKNNLMKFAKYSEEDASDIAYLISEVVVWEDLIKLLSLDHDSVTDEVIEKVLKNIDSAVVVEQTPKISVEAADE